MTVEPGIAQWVLVAERIISETTWKAEQLARVWTHGF